MRKKKTVNLPVRHAAHPSLRSGGNFMKGVECAEKSGKKNEKILRFLFFKLSSKIEVIFSQK